ncbi:flavin-binding monooxygenase-like domain-containing protein [Ditylenchus destructor]|uniref:Flavin-containing monooxygenase n=1 Tax=Ditylenchus destructor TaxID=166010 RepID=A0AAD4NCF6_9BILA|nr:flavin-binding monooxygenase-like domain-containing protein [Ditylenchus destructor]
MTAEKSVCIIGAGPAGLCTAKCCISTEAGGGNINVTIFEQNKRLGGTWVYDGEEDAAEKHSSMYENLITNRAREVMAYMGFPFKDSSSLTSPSFITRQEVLSYLDEYSQPTQHLIQYNTKVLAIERDKVSEKWKVNVKKVVDRKSQNEDGLAKCQEMEEHIFDAVFVCNGHFTVPRTPSFAEKYKKPAIHCHYYRRPSDYNGKTVAVVGAGPSGCDICLQLAECAKKVYLIHRNPSPMNTSFGPLPPNCEEVPSAIDADTDALILADGRRLNDADWAIYCVGYKYDLPFFSQHNVELKGVDNSESLIRTPGDGAMISPLFAHCIHMKYWDSLFFVGLNFECLHFIVSELQARLALAFMNHRLTKEKLKDDFDEFEEKRCSQLKTINAPLKFYHRLAAEQWNHYDWMRQLVNTANEPFPHIKPIPEVPLVVRRIYDDVSNQRQSNLQNFKKISYKVEDEENFSCIQF